MRHLWNINFNSFYTCQGKHTRDKCRTKRLRQIHYLTIDGSLLFFLIFLDPNRSLIKDFPKLPSPPLPLLPMITTSR